MRRILFALILGLSPLPATASPEALAEALEALSARDYAAAAAAQARIDDPAAAHVVTWTRLRQGRGELAEWQPCVRRGEQRHHHLPARDERHAALEPRALPPPRRSANDLS